MPLSLSLSTCLSIDRSLSLCVCVCLWAEWNDRQNYEAWAFLANDGASLLVGLLQGLASLDFLIFLKPETLARAAAAAPTLTNSDGDEDDWDTYTSFLDSSIGRRMMLASARSAQQPTWAYARMHAHTAVALPMSVPCCVCVCVHVSLSLAHTHTHTY
jgi:hypothetical protein